MVLFYFQGYEGSLIKLTSKQVSILNLYINDHFYNKFELTFFRNVARAQHSLFPLGFYFVVVALKDRVRLAQENSL